VRLSVRSTISAPSGGPITSAFVDLPDVPLSTLRLRLGGGRRGLLALAEGLCAGGAPRRLAARATLRGQNDAARTARVRLRAAPRCAR
jgi:hypothetical protein